MCVCVLKCIVPPGFTVQLDDTFSSDTLSSSPDVPVKPSHKVKHTVFTWDGTHSIQGYKAKMFFIMKVEKEEDVEEKKTRPNEKWRKRRWQTKENGKRRNLRRRVGKRETK